MNYYAEIGLRAVSEYKGKEKTLEVLTWEDFELIGKLTFLERDYRVKSFNMLSTNVFEVTLQSKSGIAGIVKMLREHTLPEPTESILHLPVKIFGFKTARREYELRINYK